MFYTFSCIFGNNIWSFEPDIKEREKLAKSKNTEESELALSKSIQPK
jgi:hypothetical protein